MKRSRKTKNLEPFVPKEVKPIENPQNAAEKVLNECLKLFTISENVSENVVDAFERDLDKVLNDVWEDNNE
jgi:hypothetical protein